MLRALYDFQSKDGKSMSFRKGQRFTLLDKSNAHWWQVMTDQGTVGYVPGNYVAKDDLPSDQVLASIDRAMEFVHLAATNKGGAYTNEQRKSLQKLVEHRQQIVRAQVVEDVPQPRRVAPAAPPTQSSSSQRTSNSCARTTTPPTSPNYSVVQRGSSTKSHKAPSPPVDTQPVQYTNPDPPPDATALPSTPRPVDVATSPIQSPTRKYRAPLSPELSKSPTMEALISPTTRARSDSLISPRLGPEMVEMVRVNTNLSFNKSKVAVAMVLNHVRESVPSVATLMEDIIKTLDTTGVSVGGGRDEERLQVIFSELTSCKDDAQQRSWALHEDESIITEYLEELLSILNDADKCVSQGVIRQDGFEPLTSLVQYYQMEVRVSIRLLLLKVFGCICSLDGNGLSHLLSSVLPVEIARDMATDTKNIQKLCFSALVLTMLLSQGESVPYTHYDQLNVEFVKYLLSSIENPPINDEDEQIPDLFVNVILAFNLQFPIPAENPVMKAFSESPNVKYFTEKFMLLVNREADPIAMFDHEPKPQNSMVKFLADIFSSTHTSNIFYTNDMRVLIDIIIRQLTDLCSGDKNRTEYISLVHSILQVTSYSEHRHRRDDLEKCFRSIAEEESQSSEMDRLIVAEIFKQFPDLF
ncbi:NCK-interacting protein with SH3 domain-like [Anneissia japonica]|uniref:NCK-interacting protein with SH3 domain-like n=1 Tax=Anneissia japonica TaxID=1529436 RepID=UPI0014256681|nr:NCK-interacting protein with SH3 domain-like [Anneissia japonica]XP_033109571.1 NCK-interacting protein with SH3 domain-like [Anneissia japonica]